MTFPDGESVETVWMPEGDAGEAGDGREAGMNWKKQTSRTGDAQLLRFQSGLAARPWIASFADWPVRSKRNLTPAKSWDRLPPS